MNDGGAASLHFPKTSSRTVYAGHILTLTVEKTVVGLLMVAGQS